MDKRALLDTILRINGAAMVQTGDIFRIVPLAELAEWQERFGLWAAVTERPGEAMTYTQNWPYEPLVGNIATPSSFLWSVFSVIFMIAGIGLLANSKELNELRGAPVAVQLQTDIKQGPGVGTGVGVGVGVDAGADGTARARRGSTRGRRRSAARRRRAALAGSR